MAGRIRTIKPEWLEDEKMSSCSVEARLLSIALLLLADDHGRGRAHPSHVGLHVFPNEVNPKEVAAAALDELERIGFILTYTVRGQRYFEVRNWRKHQRVDKPGAPRVPKPDEADAVVATGPQQRDELLDGLLSSEKATIPESVASHSGTPPEFPENDLRSPISDLRSPITTTAGREEQPSEVGDPPRRPGARPGRPELVEVLAKCAKVAGAVDVDDFANGLDAIAMSVGASDERVVAVAKVANAMVLTDPVSGSHAIGWYRKVATRLMRPGELERELAGGDARPTETNNGNPPRARRRSESWG